MYFLAKVPHIHSKKGYFSKSIYILAKVPHIHSKKEKNNKTTKQLSAVVR